MGLNIITMNIYINAWLDCSQPFISIHNKFNNELLAYFNAEESKQIIESGEIAAEDLNSSNPKVLMELVVDLIALKSSSMIQKQIGELSLSLKKRKSVFLVSEKDTVDNASASAGLRTADFSSLFTLKAV